eukprot:CAMPEP_0118702210 /NCGR_PEP_ID=MMETSP0800-20121206/17743_1 /TAXON_ID=210618 ORGANISM="Striatella unipunctata, Strain CCMP2910" /NCGR_SAMPLE_ID=MMETSP0800 /ASSEMBLY_ACC=CAM_ASM_000638 /LENGTH=63 /DNA_ID=CAMNT_0006603343 /DNA_START=199 /DNA_END=388 /DNA_ORIENTATION=+
MTSIMTMQFAYQGQDSMSVDEQQRRSGNSSGSGLFNSLGATTTSTSDNPNECLFGEVLDMAVW